MQYDVQVDRLKLRELRILLVVTQAGGIARAAKELAISNPPFQGQSPIWRTPLECPFSTVARGESSRRNTVMRCFKRGVAVFDELKQGVQDIAYLSNPDGGAAHWKQLKSFGRDSPGCCKSAVTEISACCLSCRAGRRACAL